jgi:GNAT superfamily N-acetyltransferase
MACLTGAPVLDEAMPSDFALRRLTPADLPRVAAFEREIAEISFPEDPVTDLAFYEKKLRAAIDDRRAEAIIAEVGGAIAGWAWLAERENFTTKELYGDLRSFYVAAGFRSAAVALALMRACFDKARARGLARIVGRTAAGNEAMQAVYALTGFEAKHVTYELKLGDAAPRRGGTRFSPPARSGGSRKRGSPAP